MTQVTLRFHTDDETLIDSLVTAWVMDEDILVVSGGHIEDVINLRPGRTDRIRLTYVRESSHE